MTNNPVIGSFIEDNRFLTTIQYLQNNGFTVVELNPFQDIKDQGDFNVIIHKIKTDMSNKYSKIKAYAQINPKCIMLDDPSSIELITNRIALSLFLKNLNYILGNEIAQYPSSWTVHYEDTIPSESITYPAIVKTPNDDGL